MTIDIQTVTGAFAVGVAASVIASFLYAFIASFLFKRIFQWTFFRVLCLALVLPCVAIIYGESGQSPSFAILGYVVLGVFLTILLAVGLAGVAGLPANLSGDLYGMLKEVRKCFEEHGATHETIGAIGNMLRACYRWQGKDDGLSSPNQIAAGHLDGLRKELHRVSPKIQHLFTYAAYRSVQQLHSEPGTTTGQWLSTRQYVELLRMSFQCEGICDITCLDTLSPSHWGDPGARATSISKLAWGEYFDMQKRAKADVAKPIRLRRMLLMEKIAWERDDLSYNFKGAHDEAKIALWLLPPSHLNDLSGLARDMVFFFTSDGYSWIVWSNIDDRMLQNGNNIEAKPELIAIRGGIYCGCNGVPENYLDLLKYALRNTHLAPLSPQSNPHLLGGKLSQITHHKRC